MPVTILLLALLLVAAATDIAGHKIYNWTTYPGILAAFASSGLGSLLISIHWISEETLRSKAWGGIPLGECLMGFAACGLLMLVCFVLFHIGGGDVKLIAMLGAFLGPNDGLQAMLWTFVFGGCLGIIVLIWRVGAIRLLARVARQLVWSLRIRTWSPLTDDERAQMRTPLFLAPCALAAVVIVRFFS
jgi:prepilin peptidase CpaA